MFSIASAASGNGIAAGIGSFEFGSARFTTGITASA